VHIASQAPGLAAVGPSPPPPASPAAADPVRIGVFRDAAFQFYYPENLEALQAAGAELVFLSPLSPGEGGLDRLHGLYIGGGFPEEFADKLSCQERVRQSVTRAVDAGMPVFAECGGFMYLMESLTDRHGRTYPMAGVVPAAARMQPRLAALGYREVAALTDTPLLRSGERARGHEFHYSVATRRNEEGWPHAYETAGRGGVTREGYARGNVLASYTHLHFASNPRMAERFIAACRRYKDGSAAKR
ncbi:MAG: cobyrinic acid a,c-diamide synthase, partial [Alicyclobacillus sp.]|nr:cobyrinic acid a,c-diamide synthase [Alicyclobacillus sp.]